jgi:hypothetical protein
MVQFGSCWSYFGSILNCVRSLFTLFGSLLVPKSLKELFGNHFQQSTLRKYQAQPRRKNCTLDFHFTTIFCLVLLPRIVPSAIASGLSRPVATKIALRAQNMKRNRCDQNRRPLLAVERVRHLHHFHADTNVDKE